MDEDDGGSRWTMDGHRTVGLAEGREEREMKKEQAIRMGERFKLERRD